MKTNGYKVIDFKGENLLEGSKPGIFNEILKSKKPLVFSNFTFDESNTKGQPFFVGMSYYHSYESGKYEFTFNIFTNTSAENIFLHIKDDDTFETEII